MPLMPNVPHIVGDDDELSDGHDEAQMTHAPADRKTPQSITGISYSSAGGEDSEPSSSEQSESSHDSDCDSDDEDSNCSAEEDWSNNISYIVRTPEHEPLSTPAAPAPKASPVAAEIIVEQLAEEAEVVDCDNSKPKSEMSALSVHNSPAVENCNATRSANSSPEVKMESVNEDCEQQSPLIGANVAIVTENESPAYRRRSLRSATRINRAKRLVLPTRAGRPRQRKLKVSNEGSPKTRVAKRSRQLVGPLKSPAKESIVRLARPVEVTEYFTNIAATMVSNRVNQMSFLSMRNHVDRLVGEAIAKTKMQRESDPIAKIL